MICIDNILHIYTSLTVKSNQSEKMVFFVNYNKNHTIIITASF